MFYDVKDYPVLQTIQDNINVIQQELREAEKKNTFVKTILNPTDSSLDYYTDYWVKDNGFHEDQIGYDIRDGDYSTLAIFKKDYPLKQFDVKELFSQTLKLIKTLPNIHYAGFFKMDSATHLNAHKHVRKHLIFHLLLNDLKGGDCVITCGGQSKSIKNKGDSLLFDYSYEHESINNSESGRVHFVIDFNPFS